MESHLSRRSFGIAALAALAGLAACARPMPPPPPPMAAPPPAPPAPPPAPPPPPPPPAAEMPPAPPPPALATRFRAYLRLRPGGRVIALLHPGTPVAQIGPSHGPWAHVHTPRGNGWVLRRDLRPAA
jgi:hypothetical protein